jgi:hypothetical protein
VAGIRELADDAERERHREPVTRILSADDRIRPPLGAPPRD